MIKAIIFDWFGVCTKENWADCIARELPDKLGVDEQTVRAVFKSLIQPFARAEITPEEFLQKLIGSLSKTADPNQYECLFHQTIPEINTDLLGIIQKLKSKYKIYLVSNNFGPVFPNFEKQIDFNKYFDKLFLSHELKMSKTQPEIWDKILPEIEYEPNELVFIDNKEKYFEPVNKLGLNTILYKSNEQVITELQSLGVSVE